MIQNLLTFLGKLIDAIMLKLYPMTSTDSITSTPKLPYVPASVPTPGTPPVAPETITHTTLPVVEAPTVLLFDTPQHAYHSVRVLCDNAGLPFEKTVDVDGVMHMPKDIICSVIMGESEFYNTAKNINRRADGTVGSTDWGICQINDRFHIGVGADFPSVEYVLANPDKAVEWMIKMYKLGHINWWCAYSGGRYKQFLLQSSPMWLL